MAILTYIVTLLIIPITYLFIRAAKYIIEARRLRRALVKLIPEITDHHWLLGHLHIIGDNSEEASIERIKKNPRYCLIFFGPVKTMVFLNHPETVKELTKTTEPKQVADLGYGVFRPWIGEGLLISSGDKWARNRRLLTHGFHFDVLKSYVKVYNDCADIMLDILDQESTAKKCSIDVFQPVNLCTLDIILRCAFSTTLDIQTDKENVYLQTVHQLTAQIMTRMANPFLYIDFIYFMTSSGRQFLKNCKYSHKTATDIIDERKRQLAKDVSDDKTKEFNDFLDILLLAKDEDGNGLTRQEILDEVQTFMFGGHDTTTSGTSWILYNLARHPDIQAKAREEIENLLDGRENDRIEWSDLNELPYLTQCIKESLRLHSPIISPSRLISKPLRVDDKELPIGTEVAISIVNVHLNPTVWEDPLTYNPDRFLPENIAKMDSHAFIPFSAGPRNCIGKNFAMNEMKVLVARVLRRFQITLDSSVEVKRQPGVVLRAVNGIHLFFHDRNEI